MKQLLGIVGAGGRKKHTASKRGSNRGGDLTTTNTQSTLSVSTSKKRWIHYPATSGSDTKKNHRYYDPCSTTSPERRGETSSTRGRSSSTVKSRIPLHTNSSRKENSSIVVVRKQGRRRRSKSRDRLPPRSTAIDAVDPTVLRAIKRGVGQAAFDTQQITLPPSKSKSIPQKITLSQASRSSGESSSRASNESAFVDWPLICLPDAKPSSSRHIETHSKTNNSLILEMLKEEEKQKPSSKLLEGDQGSLIFQAPKGERLRRGTIDQSTTMGDHLVDAYLTFEEITAAPYMCIETFCCIDDDRPNNDGGSPTKKNKTRRVKVQTPPSPNPGPPRLIQASKNNDQGSVSVFTQKTFASTLGMWWCGDEVSHATSDDNSSTPVEPFSPNLDPPIKTIEKKQIDTTPNEKVSVASSLEQRPRVVRSLEETLKLQLLTTGEVDRQLLEDLLRAKSGTPLQETNIDNKSSNEKYDKRTRTQNSSGVLEKTSDELLLQEELPTDTRPDRDDVQGINHASHESGGRSSKEPIPNYQTSMAGTTQEQEVKTTYHSTSVEEPIRKEPFKLDPEAESDENIPIESVERIPVKPVLEASGMLVNENVSRKMTPRPVATPSQPPRIPSLENHQSVQEYLELGSLLAGKTNSSNSVAAANRLEEWEAMEAQVEGLLQLLSEDDDTTTNDSDGDNSWSQRAASATRRRNAVG